MLLLALSAFDELFRPNYVCHNSIPLVVTRHKFARIPDEHSSTEIGAAVRV